MAKSFKSLLELHNFVENYENDICLIKRDSKLIERLIVKDRFLLKYGKCKEWIKYYYLKYALY